MKILISGAGIAGLTLAYWLNQSGHEVELIDKAPELSCRQGYMIDFWGPGFDVAEKMGLLPALKQKDHQVSALEFVNNTGHADSRLNLQALRQVLDDRICTLLRGELEHILIEKLSSRASIQAGTHLTAIDNQLDRVTVQFNHGNSRDYDLVIGADGIHSQVRQLVFGEETIFARNLGYQIAAFIQPNLLKNDRDVFYAYSAPAKQIFIYALGDDKVATFFIYKSDTPSPKNVIQQSLQREFAGMGWIVPDVLNNLTAATEVFSDSLTQIVMPNWHQQRVALVGDACQCLTLMAGQGASMAMAGAYVLAKKLEQYSGDYQQAFAAYEQQLKPSILRKQKEAQRFIRSFVPNTRFGISFRNVVTRLFSSPLLPKLLFRNLLADKFDLA